MCFPHPRGDGPRGRLGQARGGAFSPPAWGWSGVGGQSAKCLPVFPTRVGMVRLKRVGQTSGECFPHPRGDGPGSALRYQVKMKFSPPAWGWSGRRPRPPHRRRVFPTRVGMVRENRRDGEAARRFPHPRGDGPLAASIFLTCQWLSPPAWGWSDAKAHAEAVVFPPWGMVRIQVEQVGLQFSFPTRVGMVRNGRKVSFSIVFPPGGGWSASASHT